jgi:hypothetical protein
MSKPHDKPPPWHCHSEREQKLLEAWTNKQLDLLDEPTADDIRHDFENFSDDRYAEALTKYVTGRLKRGRIVEAIKSGAPKTVERLTANNEELRRWALEQLMRMRKPPGRGRKDREPRPGDYSEVERTVLQDASEDVDRIQQIWNRHYKRQNRSHRQPPTAIQISARRNKLADIAKRRRAQAIEIAKRQRKQVEELSEDEILTLPLKNWRKNHPTMC